MIGSKHQKKLYYLGILVVCLIVLGLLVSWLLDTKNFTQKRGSVRGASTTITIQPMFYDDGNFSTAVTKVGQVEPAKNIQAIVVPHHLLAAEYIAGLVKRSSGRQINTVVIIGPNHENVGREVVATANINYPTKLGLVESDQELVNKFCSDFNILLNPQVFSNEHSVGAIVPFVKYYLPKAKILPVVLSSYTGAKETTQLAKWLTANWQEDWLVIVSTDFSHYLPEAVASQNDKFTEQLINNRDVSRILTLNNDYVDSPGSLATILMLANDKRWQSEIIYHSNSFNFLTTKPAQTTSYFGVIFTD